jgi:hypothetical protein
MNDQTLFEMVRQADPLAAAARTAEPPRELLERVLVSARGEHGSARRLRGRSRLVLAVAILGLGAVVAGLAIAGTGWLTGEPAPPAVVTDFQAYTPQLGFHPDPRAQCSSPRTDRSSSTRRPTARGRTASPSKSPGSRRRCSTVGPVFRRRSLRLTSSPAWLAAVPYQRKG